MENLNVNYKRKLPTPEELKEEIILSEKAKIIKEKRDKEIADVFTGKSNKLILIIGPCSADRMDSVLDYIHRLVPVQEKVKDKIIIIPRIYTNKPRTTGVGYKGMLHQPDPDKAPDMIQGIRAIRELHKRAIEETGFCCADEMPVGMKNPTIGYVSIMLNSIKAAQSKHVFSYGGWEVETKGNFMSHAILRGSVDEFGRNHPNYHYEELESLYDLYCKGEYKNPAVIIDANHANSGKKYIEQIRIVNEVLESMSNDENISKMVKGFMIESYIEDGAQKPEEHVYGKSITDSCLGWDKTEKLIFSIAEHI